MDLTKYYPDIVAKYPAYVTKRELCEICHICPKTAYNLEQQGEIPYTIEQNHLIRSHKIKLTDILAYGAINSKGNILAFSDDDQFPLLRSIEDERKDKTGWDKSAIFTKATIRPFRQVNHADTAEDALQICLNHKLRVDLPYMSFLTGKAPQELVQELDTRIYLNPQKYYGNERRAQQDAREQQLAQERQARYDSAIREAEGNIMAGKEVINREINGKSLIMQLFREHEIPVPLKTQGWIINSLHSIRYDPQIGEWNYRYFKGSRNSTKMFDLLSKLSAAIQTRQQFEEHGASPPDSPVLDCEEEQDMEL